MQRTTINDAIDAIGIHHIIVMCPHCLANARVALKNQKDVIMKTTPATDMHIIAVCHDQ